MLNTDSPREIELKLALGPEAERLLPAHPRLAGRTARIHQLTNTYFDTPDRDLEQARVALRLRRDGDRVVQTVKTAGQGHGGLHARGEWEWPLDGETLDTDGLARLGLPVFEQASVREALVPVYRTDFERRTWQLSLDADNSVEVAFDRGEILAGEHRTPIYELELELHGSDPALLWQLAEALAESVPLRPANTSKAERAVALREQRWPLPECALDTPDHCVERAFTALDAWHDTGETRYLFTARRAFDSLTRHDDPILTGLAARLADRLNRPAWLDSTFGTLSLTLLAHLRQTAPAG
ncbi:CYTH domain-containing protein [Kushneria sinocarnis]|uniref:CYTH domain-containing protein n=1 Tax=Kushneria sinocarnis TaxID=595502 RepID=A0A420WZM6_9GAMM|nr:CYTH domain-containing protein [Kushneria sinocarnis]RKR06734.1 CYTH domain-containing protein [Kushneria sinocarnis]